jgi:hypothetical protein
MSKAHDKSFFALKLPFIRSIYMMNDQNSRLFPKSLRVIVGLGGVGESVYVGISIMDDMIRRGPTLGRLRDVSNGLRLI